jgi:hypothetical protein
MELNCEKTEDVLQLSSALGYRKDTLSNWFHTAKFNFATQFTDGYAYPNKDISVSRPFAPLYILGTWSGICFKRQTRIALPISTSK